MGTSNFKRDWPTIGILAGWSAHESLTPDHYLGSVLQGIQSAARIRKCHLLLAWGVGRVTDVNNIYPAWPEVSPETDFVPVGPWNTDGLIVFIPLRSESRSSYIHQLMAEDHPIIFIGTGEQGPTISVDNDKGIRQAIAHLVDHGHRRIAFIAGSPLDKGDSETRLHAFHSAISEYGLELDTRLVAEGWHTIRGGYQAMQQILDSGAKFTALMASNDGSAIGAMQALREASLQIPQDVAIIGFDDQPDAMAQEPPLTSIQVPLTTIGEHALFAMLDHLIGNKPLESVQISTRLVRRRSCGCIPTAISSAADDKPRTKSIPAGRVETDSDAVHRKKELLVNNMLAVMTPELRILDEERYRLTCQTLVDAFYTSLEKHNSAHFQKAITKFLDALETSGAIAPWQEMITVLRREMKQLPLKWDRISTYRLAEDLLHQLRVAISEAAEWKDQQHQYQHTIAAKALSELTARLSATLDEHQAVDLLDAHLAEIGIRHARIYLFEPGENDPVAWSVLLNESNTLTNYQRFASRQFPPSGLYPPEEQLNILLFPLVFQDEALGYIAFDASDMESCFVIATQMAATIKTSRLHAQVIELSLTDALTGLHNRRYFDFFLNNEVNRQQRFARGLAIFLLDIDNFKQYNDKYGHPAGDKALQHVATCLSLGARSSDMVARIGGDEFAMILPETDVSGALDAINRIRAAIAGLSGLERPISASFGVTALQGIGLEAETLLKQADIALYQAKRTGRNRFIVFEENSMKDQI